MRVKIINSIPVQKDLDASSRNRVAALDAGIYQAKPLDSKHLAIETPEGNLVYLDFSTLEEKIYK